LSSVVPLSCSSLSIANATTLNLPLSVSTPGKIPVQSRCWQSSSLPVLSLNQCFVCTATHMYTG
jgi:hypothetical protein